jgi:hypothetical protein
LSCAAKDSCGLAVEEGFEGTALVAAETLMAELIVAVKAIATAAAVFFNVCLFMVFAS